MQHTHNITLPEQTLALLNTYLSQAISHAGKPLAIDPAVLAYRWVADASNINGGHLEPITMDITGATAIQLNDLLGIERQKQRLINNTRQFLQGLPANHVLMTGTRGGGKSSLVRALLSQFATDGLRLIEVARMDLSALDKIRQAVSALPEHANVRYVVYCDDLAFDKQDESYRALKSVLDGSLSSEQDKLLVYATSNRRHLLPQLMKDNRDIYNGQTDEVNPYETIDETVSLSDRFGIWLSFQPMTQDTYVSIARHYVHKLSNSHLSDSRGATTINLANMNEEITNNAIRFASERGGRSGRVAYQFARDWVGKIGLTQLG